MIAARHLVVALACAGVGSACHRDNRTVAKTIDNAAAAAPVDPAAKPNPPVDIMLVLDLSKSMEETDITPDRLAATKSATRTFVAGNTHDRIGIVIFAQAALLRLPLTGDVKALDETIADLRIGDVPELGTGIGDALALAVDELRSGQVPHKVVILLADGDNNWTIRFDPKQAAALARDHGIVVHAMLVGTDSESVNPATLQEIAATTGGTFHRVTDPASFDRNLRDVRDVVRRMSTR